MYSGGIADKIGNRYEAKVLVHKLLDVLMGKANWLRFEGIIPEFNGFEFAIGIAEKTEWYQTKINSSSGNWTVRSLKSEGVLSAFSSRLISDEKCTCHFISQHPCKDLEVFTEKARVANSFQEYIDGLSEQQTLNFTDLVNDWGMTKTECFYQLKRSYFDTISIRLIESHIATQARILFTEWNEDVFSVLRDYLETNINKVISTEKIRDFLSTEKNIGFKDWSLDPTLKQRLSDQTKRYLNTYIPFGAGGNEIARKETDDLIKEVSKARAAKVVLLTGGAGSGKSGVIRAFIKHLQSQSIAHLAYRIDQHLDCKTPEQIGVEIIGRNESPAITLHGVSQGQRSVLIIDQVDAVSEVSGRNGIVKNAILEILDDIQSLNILVILVCRDFDLDNDARLKSLAGQDMSKRIKVDLLSWEHEICPVLEKMHIDVKLFSEGQKQLLSLPLNLALYLEINDRKVVFDNREDLFRALVEKKQKNLHENKAISWQLLDPLKKLANWMSEKQRLDAPSLILDDYPQAVSILSSEGLIVSQGQSINFFHESFFDYIYARSFFNSERSITDLLLSTQQHLFRRTQVRQILEVLRQHNRERYLQELANLFADCKVRYHIKIAIAKWLGSLKDPVEREREIGISQDNNHSIFSPIPRAILFGSASWFDLHFKNGWLLDILNGVSKERRDFLLWRLLNLSNERPKEVAEVLRTWWDNKPERALDLIQRSIHVNTKNANDDIEYLEALYCDLISSVPDGMFFKSTSNSRDLILSTWVDELPKRSSRVLKVYLETWFKEHPGDHPFSRDHLSDLDMHSLSNAAKANPSAFIMGFVDCLNKAIEIINGRHERDEYDSAFESIREDDCYGSNEFSKAFRNALKSVAKTDADLAKKCLEGLDAAKHKIFLHFHLEAISANPEEMKDHFITLLNNAHLLEAGFEGAEWKSFAVAARETLPFLSSSYQSQVESIIQSSQPELFDAKKTIHDEELDTQRKKLWVIRSLNNSGYQEWCILETIGSENLSLHMSKRLLELRRKFQGKKVAEERTSLGGTVRSPISLEHAQRMSDQQWLRAIEKYKSNDDREFHRHYVIGGAEQLAQILSACTKKEPNRFIKLLSQIPLNSNICYLRGILSGLHQSEGGEDEVIRDALDFAHQYPEKPFGREYAHIVRTYPNVCKDKKIIDNLMWYAREGEESDRIVRTTRTQNLPEELTSIDDVVNRHEDLYMSGLNSVRGGAIYALSRVYWQYPGYSDVMEPFIEERINLEPLASVRCILTELLLPFYNHDRDKCGVYLEKLVELSLDKDHALIPLMTHDGIRLMQHILFGAPQSGHRLLQLLLDGTKRKENLIGAWLALGASYQMAEYSSIANELIQRGNEYLRLDAQIAANFVPSAHLEDRAFIAIQRYFNDDDEHVRRNAVDCFRYIKSSQIDENKNLINSYLNSKAFSDDDAADFLRLLTSAESDIHEYVILAAEKIFSTVKENKNPQKGGYRDYLYLDDLLEKEYAGSEGNQDLRDRYLDIIDTMLELEMHGSEKIVRSHERHH